MGFPAPPLKVEAVRGTCLTLLGLVTSRKRKPAARQPLPPPPHPHLPVGEGRHGNIMQGVWGVYKASAMLLFGCCELHVELWVRYFKIIFQKLFLNPPLRTRGAHLTLME